VSGQGLARSYLPVQPASAEVLAIDGRGRPALLRYPSGQGWMVLCTYPLEYMAASRPQANPEQTWRLYSALATAAQVVRPVRVEDPRVVVGGLRVGPKEAFLALNVSPDDVRARLLAPAQTLLAGGEPPEGDPGELALGPYEVALRYLSH
jgi:hypothetical protein